MQKTCQEAMRKTRSPNDAKSLVESSCSKNGLKSLDPLLRSERSKRQPEGSCCTRVVPLGAWTKEKDVPKMRELRRKAATKVELSMC